jgi:hypothetical protein
MKLLDTSGGNTKLAKNNKDVKLRVAGLSMMPDDTVCIMRWIAACAKECLKLAGRGTFNAVERARQAKTDWYHSDRKAFIAQLIHEITLFEKLCKKNEVECWIRLNVLSDVRWELMQNGAIPQRFPDINFYDYTKVSKRMKKLPANYQLMFSYSKAEEYQTYVEQALQTDVPMSVVFLGPMPKTFLGREVVNGDVSDILNLYQRGKIIGLTYKVAKAKAGEDKVDPRKSNFVVDTNCIPLLIAA